MPNPNVGLGAANAGEICGFLVAEMTNNNGRFFETMPDKNGIVTRFIVPSANAVSGTSTTTLYCFGYETMIEIESTDPMIRQYGLDGVTKKRMTIIPNTYINPATDTLTACPDNAWAKSPREIQESAEMYGMADGRPKMWTMAHARTSCDFCAGEYYKGAGGNCVECPAAGADQTRYSWGDGGIETCFVKMDLANLTVNGNDTTGSYTITYTPDTSHVSVGYLTYDNNLVICPYVP